MAQDSEHHSNYDQGYIDGLTVYAHWKEGEQLVGTTGNTLRSAISNRKDNYNYREELDIRRKDND